LSASSPRLRCLRRDYSWWVGWNGGQAWAEEAGAALRATWRWRRRISAAAPTVRAAVMSVAASWLSLLDPPAATRLDLRRLLLSSRGPGLCWRRWRTAGRRRWKRRNIQENAYRAGQHSITAAYIQYMPLRCRIASNASFIPSADDWFSSARADFMHHGAAGSGAQENDTDGGKYACGLDGSAGSHKAYRLRGSAFACTSARTCPPLPTSACIISHRVTFADLPPKDALFLSVGQRVSYRTLCTAPRAVCTAFSRRAGTLLFAFCALCVCCGTRTAYRGASLSGMAAAIRTSTLSLPGSVRALAATRAGAAAVGACWTAGRSSL